MKVFALLLLFSAQSFAASVCHYRFNPRLAVTMTFETNRKGGISWDDKNVCAGDLCTQIYPGTFKVDYRGRLFLEIRKLAARDDLGNHYQPNSLMGKFVRNTVFRRPYFFWRGRSYRMNCRETTPSL